MAVSYSKAAVTNEFHAHRHPDLHFSVLLFIPVCPLGLDGGAGGGEKRETAQANFDLTFAPRDYGVISAHAQIAWEMARAGQCDFLRLSVLESTTEYYSQRFSSIIISPVSLRPQIQRCGHVSSGENFEFLIKGERC